LFFQPIEIAGLLEQQARQILRLFKYHAGFLPRPLAASLPQAAEQQALLYPPTRLS
jgi:hypothetical protein